MTSRGALPVRARILAMLVALAATAAGCGSPAPSPSPEPSRPPIAATARSAAPSTPGPTAAPTPSPTIAVTASPSATTPPIVGATQSPCPGSSGGRRGKVVTGQSRNWAGYIVGGGPSHVTCIEGTWDQPTIRCPASGETSVAVWVGIDGSSAVGGLPDASATLAQTGTVGNCVNGQPQYNAWYEFLPDLHHMVMFQLPVTAGDSIWAKVQNVGKGRFVATLINLTQRVGTTQAWTLRLAPLLTAEWVVEDPAASCSDGTCTFVTLARFSVVAMNGAVTMGSRRYKLTAMPYLYLRTTINRSGKTLAVPSSMGSGGFVVTWKSS